MYSYKFKIADIIMRITTPFPMEMEERHKDFLFDGDYEVRVHFQIGEINNRQLCILNDIFYEAYYDNGRYSICKKEEKNEKPFAEMLCISKKEYLCTIPENEWWRVKTSGDLFEMMDWIYILNQNDVFLLHASFITWKNQGILFSGPSGIGKSTQASLWENHENANIINGDRAAIKYKTDNIYAYGLPYAGSSKIFRNEKRQLKAIVVLNKGIENSFRYISKTEAFRYLYQETVVQSWDKNYMNNLIEQIMGIIEGVPVLHYTCTPDVNAIEVLKRELEGIMS